MPRIKLITNPWADRGRAGDQARIIRNLIEEFVAKTRTSDDPIVANWVGTVYPGQAAEYAQEAAEDNYDIVAAVGGDGTVHEVVNGLMRVPAEARPVMGVIPLGSGNDFASNIGLPQSAGECVNRLFSTGTRTVDIARLTDGSGRNEYFDNTVNVGFGGAVSIATRKIQRIYGFWMYLTAVLQTIAVNYESPRMQVTMDGESMDDELMMFVLANGPREGGGFHVAPDAVMDDGMLDYVYITKVSRPMMLRLIPEVMNARHMRFSQVGGGKAKHITIESDVGLPIHADGEIFGPWEAKVRHVEAEIIPGAIRVAF